MESTLSERVKELLNQYFEKELGNSFVLPDANSIRKQREAFRERFGPERLAKMSGLELLRELPYNVSGDQPMDYWFEFKNDDSFNTRLFGSIRGGSAAKFGTWQDRRTLNWKAKRQGAKGVYEISEDEAIKIVDSRRTEILNTASILEKIIPQKDKIDPVDFQKQIEHAAPTWHSIAWFHKYMHILFPELITWAATDAYAIAELYRAGEVPEKSGIFAQDCQKIQFWDSLPVMEKVDPDLRYFCGHSLDPRHHFVLNISTINDSVDEMIDEEMLILGPSCLRDLSDAVEMESFKEVSQFVSNSFKDSGIEPDHGEIKGISSILYHPNVGNIIVLVAESSKVLAVGEICGHYSYKSKSKHQHQVPVNWQIVEPFNLSSSVKTQKKIDYIKHFDPTVAEIEGNLLLNGFSPWPNFESLVDRPVRKKRNFSNDEGVVSNSSTLPPMEGLNKQVAGMLERKHQIILYGPPGTGKTFHAVRVAREIIARDNFSRLSAELSSTELDRIYGRDGNAPYIAFCTFHPMYSYEDFIEGYRPTGDGFELEPGIFRRMVNAAEAEPQKRFVLIIDEINRGNIPKIFGELITLIESTKRGKGSTILPLSKDNFMVPKNLYLIGTMNTADRSILLIDTALRRRFAFKELLPDPELLRSGKIADVSLSTWLRALNRRIVEQLGRDGRNLQIGHSYLMQDGKPVSGIQQISQIVQDEIWPLLQEYCYEDSNKLAQILGAGRGGIFNEQTGSLREDLFERGRESDLEEALCSILTSDDKTEDAGLDDDTGPAEEELDEADAAT